MEEIESSFSGRSIPASTIKKFLSLEEYREAQIIQIKLFTVEQLNIYVKLTYTHTSLLIWFLIIVKNWYIRISLYI